MNGISKEKREKERQLIRQRRTQHSFSDHDLPRNFAAQFEMIAIMEIAEKKEKKQELVNQNVTTPSVVIEAWRIILT